MGMGPSSLELPNQLILQTGHRNAETKTAPWTPNATQRLQVDLLLRLANSTSLVPTWHGAQPRRTRKPEMWKVEHTHLSEYLNTCLPYTFYRTHFTCFTIHVWQISGSSYKYWSKKLCYIHIYRTHFTIHVSHILPYTFDRFQVGATSIGARNCATIHIYRTHFTIHVSHILPYTFDRFQVGATSIGARNCATVHIYRTCFTHFTVHIWQISGWSYKYWSKKLCYPTCCTIHVLLYHTRSTIHISYALPYMFYHTHFQRLQIGIATIRGWNYPLAVLCQDLSLFTLLAAVLWIEEEGWWGGPFQAFWSSWVEHHARLVQGLSNWQVWAVSPPATFVLHLEFRVQFWFLHSCVQFAVSADWKAQGKRVPSP